MRDYAELSKSVHCCVDCQCEICPRGDTPFGYIECKRKLADDTADAIEELLEWKRLLESKNNLQAKIIKHMETVMKVNGLPTPPKEET